MYKSIFIDLDDTVWAFSENARDTFQDMYEKYHFERYFDSFHQFYTIYSGRNEILWGEYGADRGAAGRQIPSDGGKTTHCIQRAGGIYAGDL
jgi:FMN phosphatase YigB (HAD superfamily)